jgi:hypothetical protein
MSEVTRQYGGPFFKGEISFYITPWQDATSKKNRTLRFPSERPKYSHIRASLKTERMAMSNSAISEVLNLFNDNFNWNMTSYLRCEKKKESYWKTN